MPKSPSDLDRLGYKTRVECENVSRYGLPEAPSPGMLSFWTDNLFKKSAILKIPSYQAYVRLYAHRMRYKPIESTIVLGVNQEQQFYKYRTAINFTCPKSRFE